MKKSMILSILLACAMTASFTACGTNESLTSTDSAETTVAEEEEEETYPDASDMNIQKEDGKVILNFPAGFVTYADQEAADEAADADDTILSITMNDDGSATAVYTEEGYESRLENLDQGKDEFFDTLVESAVVSSITAIESNDDCTELTVTVEDESVVGTDDFSNEMDSVFYVAGTILVFHGEEPNVTCNVVNTDGDVLTTLTYPDAE